MQYQTLEDVLDANAQGRLREWLIEYLQHEGGNPGLAKHILERPAAMLRLAEYPIGGLQRLIGPEDGMLWQEDGTTWERRVTGFLRNSRRPRTAYNLAIVRRGDAAAIGWIGAGRPRDSVLGDQDFGYALNRQSWGCGYATEALRALVAYLFEHGGARKISGECVGPTLLPHG